MKCERCEKDPPVSVPFLVTLAGKQTCIECARTMPEELIQTLRAKKIEADRKARNKRRNLRKKLERK